MAYFPPSRPRAVQGGLTARSTRGSIGATWWSRRFIAVLEGFALGSRLTRGRAYARRGQVISLQVAPGAVSALVQGSRASPYRVSLGLTPFPAAVWAQADAALAGEAIHAAALLAGHVPPELEDLFEAAGARLFPQSLRDLALGCSCPDHEVVCKHVAASFYLLAERFDDDPFEILHWRGRPREALLARVRELRSAGDGSIADDGPGSGGARAGAASSARRAGIGTGAALAELADGLAVSAVGFWSSPVPLPPRPAALDTPADLLLRQLPDPPAALGGAGLTTALRPLYAALPDPEPDPGAEGGTRTRTPEGTGT